MLISSGEELGTVPFLFWVPCAGCGADLQKETCPPVPYPPPLPVVLQAERCRLLMARDEVLAAAAADLAATDTVALLDVTGNFMFDPAAHQDFLGAITGTGAVCIGARGEEGGICYVLIVGGGRGGMVMAYG